MRGWVPAVAFLLLAGAVGAPAGAGPPNHPQSPEPGQAFSRSLDVAAAGWVKAILPAEDLARCGPDAADIRVFDPHGQEVLGYSGILAPPLRTAVDPPGLAAPPRAMLGGNAECRRESTFAVCRPALPAVGQVPLSLTVDLDRRASIGYRLYGEVANIARSRPYPGAFVLSPWTDAGPLQILAAGVWRPGEERRIELQRPGWQAPQVDGLRLEIYDASALPPRVGYRLELAPAALRFQAAAPGRYRLAFGSGAGYRAGLAPLDDSGPEARPLEPGPLVARRLPPPPSRATEPELPLEKSGFGISWAVAAGGVVPGEVVRLEVPDAVFDRLRLPAGAKAQPGGVGLERLRLSAGGLQVPYVLWQRGEPRLVAEIDDLRPVVDTGKPQLPNVILAHDGVPLDYALVTASRPPFEAQICLAAVFWGCNPQEQWSCRRVPHFPCRLNQRLDRLAGAPRWLVSSTMMGRSLPPEARFDLSLWRRPAALVFVWPAGASVRLLAASAAQEAPSYDLAAIAGELLAQPWKPAFVGAETAPENDADWHPLAALVLAAGLLFAGLCRLWRALATT